MTDIDSEAAFYQYARDQLLALADRGPSWETFYGAIRGLYPHCAVNPQVKDYIAAVLYAYVTVRMRDPYIADPVTCLYRMAEELEDIQQRTQTDERQASEADPQHGYRPHDWGTRH